MGPNRPRVLPPFTPLPRITTAAATAALTAPLRRILGRLAGLLLMLALTLGSAVAPVAASLETDHFDVVVYYLDDSSVSKRFAPVVSELQRIWGNTIELIPLVTDPLQPGGKTAAADLSAGDPSRYWSGLIPQVVVFDRSGAVAFDASGQVEVDAINAAVSQATDLPLPALSGQGSTRSFNELNSEVVSSGR
jgi:hypothetical protein